MHGLSMTRRSALMGIAAIGVMTGTARRAFAAEKWDFTIYYGPGHSLTKLYGALCDDVRDRTGGALEITLRPAGELPFSAAEAVTVAGTGQLPMALGYMGFIAGTTKIAAMPGLPFLITDAAEAETAMGVLLPYVDKAVQQAGAKVLMWNGQHWPQNLYGRGEPVTSLAQLKGRNARGSSPEQGDIIRHFGGAPVTLTTAEVPEAMNRGVMDAVFTGAANITGSRWNEFLDWGYLCRPNTGIEYILVNQELYDDLAPELRKALDDAIAEHRPKMGAALRQVNEESQALLGKELKITEASPEEVKAYASEFTDYWLTWAKAAGPDGEEALTKIRAALGK